MTAVVRNNTALHRFELDVKGHTAVLHYRLAPGVMMFVHTEVPPQLRERGIGAQLVQGALDHVRAAGLKMVPRCSFVRHVLAEHPEYRDLLV